MGVDWNSASVFSSCWPCSRSIHWHERISKGRISERSWWPSWIETRTSERLEKITASTRRCVFEVILHENPFGTLTVGSPSEGHRFSPLTASTQRPDFANVSLVGHNLEWEEIYSSDIRCKTPRMGSIRRHWPNKWRWYHVQDWRRRAALRYGDFSPRRDENSMCPSSIDVN